MASTILGRVRVVTTWNAWTPGGGSKKGIWVMAWENVSQMGFSFGGGGGGESGISGVVWFSGNS
jgi:hypothetical protein